MSNQTAFKFKKGDVIQDSQVGGKQFTVTGCGKKIVVFQTESGEEHRGHISRFCTVATQQPKPFDTVGFIIDFENGTLSEEEVIEGFQHLISSGTVWQLQGCYGRTAAALIEAGHCTAK